MDSPFAEVGRIFDWVLQQTIDPGKSLGIAHMKLATAREVAQRFDLKAGDGTPLAQLSDASLAKYIEQYPQEDLRLAAYYLKELRENPLGSGTDEDLFLLYSANTDQVREFNQRYGADTSHRSGDILARILSWQQAAPVFQAAAEWEALASDERESALRQLAATVPSNQTLVLNFPWPPPPGVQTSIQGTGPIPRGVPSPEPGPSPTP